MQSPNTIVSILSNKSSQNAEYQFKRLYRILYNKEFYYFAYSEMAPKSGNMTAGMDNKTLDGFKKETVVELIQKLKDFSYQPKPVRRVYIPKKNNSSKKRPLGIPSIEDKLVQYIIKYILEAIYECKFSEHSHGFRCKRSCHTALRDISKNYRGTKWFIEGDIKGFFDNINHQVLINILRRNIKDENFIALINKFLKAGYLENWQFHKTYSGTPQGGIISPILANIYLNELDKYMENLSQEFARGKPQDRKISHEYQSLTYQLAKIRRENKASWSIKTKSEKKYALKEVQKLKVERSKYPLYDPKDESYKKLAYIRYADDFIIGIQGSKADAIYLKSKIKDFLSECLKLELSDEKTLITHSSDKARFLGYDVSIRRSIDMKRDKNHVTKKTLNYKVSLMIPTEVWQQKLRTLKVLKIKKGANNEEIWSPIHRPELMCVDDLEIITKYNAEIRGLYNYYKYADNSTVLQKFRYIMEYSMYKTYAGKYKSSIGKIKSEYRINGKFAIKYETKTGSKMCFFYNEGFRKHNIIKECAEDNEADLLPDKQWIFGRNSLVNRLLSDTCELCGKQTDKIEMHHIRKMKDLKGKQQWEIVMIAKKRKTLAVCHDCHVKITNQQRTGNQ